MAPGSYLNIGGNGSGGSATLGSGTLTLQSGSQVEAWYYNPVVPNAVSLGSSVSIGGSGSNDNYNTLTFSGIVTATSSSTTLNLNQNAQAVLSGTLTGPASSQILIQGNGANLPNDGGSLLVVSGTTNNIAGVTIANAQVILAPAGTASTAFSSVQAGGLTIGTDSGPGYLGLDGTFAASGAVTTFLTTYGAGIGASINGTLGFDSYNLGTTNVFNDPIDLSNFTSGNFTGLGTSTLAVLGPTAVITPPTSGPQANEYVFGGGGGTLYVRSPLTGSNGLVMNYSTEPLTVLVQGAGASYTNGTNAEGGVLIFDAPAPSSGTITFSGEAYVGFTENASNVASSQAWVSLFESSSTVGVIGFDSTLPASPRTISDPIDLSGFYSENNPFIGTATAVTITSSINPNSSIYQFTGVKGGQLTIGSLLQGANSVTIGLYTPIENNGSVSTVTLTNPLNTYSNGTTFNSGVLVVGATGALGSSEGLITVQDPATISVTPVLMPASGSVSVTVPNNITLSMLSGGTQYYLQGLDVGNPNTSDMLVLSGNITDNGSPGQLGVMGSVTLSGANTYSGGTAMLLNSSYQGNPQIFVNSSMSLGTGPLDVMATGSLIPLAPVTIPNRINLWSGQTLTLGGMGYTSPVVLSGLISDGSNGAGNLVIDTNTTISSANTYSGGTTVNGSTVTLGNVNALGTGTVTLNASTIAYGISNPTIIDLVGDVSSVITLQSGSTLTLNTDNYQSEYTYSGQINGDAETSVVKTGLGTEFIAGASVYAAGTTVSQGTLIAGNGAALGTGPVTVQSGAQLGVAPAVTFTNNVILNNGGGLSGEGTFDLPTATDLSSGSFVMPGTAIQGQYVAGLSFTNSVTFDVGGLYVFNLENAGGVAGTDYSTLYVTGPLYISANAGSPFTIQLVSIGSNGAPGLATFNPALSYSWTLATSAGGIAFFNANDFVVDTSQFQNSTAGGSFAVGEVGDTLTLNFTPVPEPGEWALIVAGCAMMGVWTLRRRRA